MYTCHRPKTSSASVSHYFRLYSSLSEQCVRTARSPHEIDLNCTENADERGAPSRISSNNSSPVMTETAADGGEGWTRIFKLPGRDFFSCHENGPWLMFCTYAKENKLNRPDTDTVCSFTVFLGGDVSVNKKYSQLCELWSISARERRTRSTVEVLRPC